MATVNPFDLLGDDDNDDPSQLIAAQQKKIEPKKAPIQAQAQQAKAAKLPSKPLPPTQAGELSIHFLNLSIFCVCRCVYTSSRFIYTSIYVYLNTCISFLYILMYYVCTHKHVHFPFMFCLRIDVNRMGGLNLK